MKTNKLLYVFLEINVEYLQKKLSHGMFYYGDCGTSTPQILECQEVEPCTDSINLDDWELFAGEDDG